MGAFENVPDVQTSLRHRERGRVFLTAEWRHLAMLNYEVEPSLLQPFVPRGTELDLWNGRAFLSVVGFLFLRTRVFGVPIPFHRNFEEVNLRMYVRRDAGGGLRRGVVFIKEIVPRRAIASVARRLYNEPYIALPMHHRIGNGNDGLPSAEYGWRFAGRTHALRIKALCPKAPLKPGSEAEFITEHYWGYNRQRDGSTLEYHVEHPPWLVAEQCEGELECDAAALYGKEFGRALAGRPASAFLADGSRVAVMTGQRLST